MLRRAKYCVLDLKIQFLSKKIERKKKQFYVVRLALATWSLRECLEHASNVGLLPWILQPGGGRGIPKYSNRPFVK